MPYRDTSFPSVVFAHITHTQRIYMQIAEVAEQRGCQVRHAGAVSRLGALLKGTSAVALEVNQLTPYLFFWSDRDVNRRPFGSKSKSLETEPLPCEKCFTNKPLFSSSYPSSTSSSVGTAWPFPELQSNNDGQWTYDQFKDRKHTPH